MIGNPEFRRNLWLELTPQRLIVMPLVLAAIFVVVYLGEEGIAKWNGDSSRYGGLAMAAKYIYLALVLLWGGRQAAAAVTDEIRDRTWDGQRLSALGSWSMAWGKLFGSTVFVWYGGVLALAVYAVSAVAQAPAPAVARDIVTLIGYGVLCHATALLASLLYLRHKTPSRRPNAGLFHLAGLAAVVVLWVVIDGYTLDKVGWPMSRPVLLADFALGSVVAFAVWAVIGVWRLMRSELQFRNLPWLWTLFALFLMVYMSAFVAGPLDPIYRLLLPTFVLQLCTYLLALVEPKDVVGLRRLASRARIGDVRGFFEALPLWLLTYAFVATGTVLSVALAHDRLPTPETAGLAMRMIAVAFLFMTRDLSILLALNLGRNPRRADLAAILYWAVLYALVPLLLNAFGERGAAALFRPGGTEAVVVSALVQAALALAWVAWRWRTAGRAIGLAKAGGTGQIPA
jgi:hypothetical protein